MKICHVDGCLAHLVPCVFIGSALQQISDYFDVTLSDSLV